ncbi:MAG TPA: AAA family ATPase [Streptosporangiaceae bacterium]|jgi:cell division protease FtsH|nr:AAA family ATPase [Streptosporangiaceae bacterium]
MMKRPEGPAAEGLPPPGGRPRDEDRLTRKPLALWDRIKFLILLALVWFILVWSVMASDPLVGFSDAMRIEVQTGWWVFALLGLEAVRQVHFLVSEHWRGYYRFWTALVFGGWERLTRRRVSDWSRFRIWRLVTWLFWIAVVAVVTGKIIHTTPLLALLRAPRLIWGALPFVLQLAFAFFFIAFQFIGLFWLLSRGGVDVYYPDDIKTRFSDVWGQDHVLERVKENILFLENPELVEEKGGYVPGGLLLWGPPGTGKTLMAEAVAGETGRPYVFVDPGAFINMFMGVGILKVKSLFRKLRRLALRYGGVIVFFDEADSLGNRGQLATGGVGGGRGTATPAPFAHAGCHGFSYLSRDTQWLLTRHAMDAAIPDEPDTRRSKQILAGGMMGGNGGGMGTLQALLTEMSGLKKPRGLVNRYVRRILGMRPKPPPKYRILIMMATNMPSALDEALLRPGRIDRIYKVGYPSKAGRVRTYEGYLGKVKHELTGEQIDKLATITPYATGATIKDLVNEALITAIRNGRDVITWPDVIKAKQLKELGPPEDVEYIERERHAVAVHEACHALIAFRMRQHMEIDVATIEKGSDYLGMVASIPPEDQFTRWRSEYETDILVSLASLAGERMFFDSDSSSGVSGDLESATTVASYMEGFWGMGSTVSSYSTAKRLEVGAPGGGRGGALKKGQDPEAEVRRALADRIEDKLSALLDRTAEILTQNRDHVLALAHALETHKTLSGEDVVAVLEHKPGPVVDGTPYGDPAFLAQLADYHAAAARAHREHSQEQLVLPAPAFAAAATLPAACTADGDRPALDGHGGTGQS